MFASIWFRGRNGTWDGPADGFAALGNLISCAAWVLWKIWPMAALTAVFAALHAWDWWRKRRNKGKAKAWLGAKSKALRDALVAKQREVTKPRPVLRPVPRGAA
jgi:hypothetical protein